MCKYCSGEEVKIKDEDWYGQIYLKIENNSLNLETTTRCLSCDCGDTNFENIQISYCPFCGRKLMNS